MPANSLKDLQGKKKKNNQYEISDNHMKTSFNHLPDYPKDVSLATGDSKIIKPSCYIRTDLLLPYYSLTRAEERATGGLGTMSWEKGETDCYRLKAGQTAGEYKIEC